MTPGSLAWIIGTLLRPTMLVTVVAVVGGIAECVRIDGMARERVYAPAASLVAAFVAAER